MARKSNDPIESVELTISVKTGKAAAERIREALPSARLRRGSLELKVVGESPTDVSRKAEEMMEKLREAIGPPKDFKNADGPPKKK